MKNTYDITDRNGALIGQVKAKDMHLAAKQARRKFWPKGETSFRFSVSVNRDISSANDQEHLHRHE
jgi:hypothetical protein